ncbi:Glutathione S-transferase [Mycena chlorophos]|uniref:Glutathione S-transferase n=1 Tax=Mycena chlorophos TaxID=658473 RepID=A0A8H6TJG7_MYCCL|nr:Glutathione S-transferase [Mycena chlorophos]
MAITLYGAKICPFTQRVEMALYEAKAGYSRFEVDLVNKPEWFARDVNPASKVPAIAYGGPQTSPDQPSPLSTKLTESLVLLEFVADLYPNSSIFPTDPILRAKSRFFIDAVTTRFLPPYMGPIAHAKSFEPFWDALDSIQRLLPEDKVFAISDEFTVADMAIAPFLGRMEVWMKNDIGAYPKGEGLKAAEYFFNGERFKRFVRYFDAIKARESYKHTIDMEYLRNAYAARFEPLRAKLQEAAAAQAAVNANATTPTGKTASS